MQTRGRKVVTSATYFVVAFLAALVACGAVAAGETSLRIEQSQTPALLFTPTDGDFSVSRPTTSQVFVTFHTPSYSQNWSVSLNAPSGQPLTVGSYTTLGNYHGNQLPGLWISGSGLSCNSPEGSFEIKQASYGPDNSIAQFWAVFIARCGANTLVSGELRINAAVFVALSGPREVTVERGRSVSFDVAASDSAGRSVVLAATGLPAGATFTDKHNNTGTFAWQPGYDVTSSPRITFRADNGHGHSDSMTTLIKVEGETSLRLNNLPGGSVGGGGQLITTSAESQFSVSSYDNGLSIGVSMSSLQGSVVTFRSWNVTLRAPQGHALRVGAYTGAVPFPDANSNNPTVNIWGNGINCSPASGSFEVKGIKYDQRGLVSEFWATFEQYCYGATTALSGEIRYNANVIVSVDAPVKKHAERGQTVSFDVRATEINGRLTRLTAEELPPGALFTDNHNNTGTFTWRPQPTQQGVFRVTFKADTENGAANTNSTNITVPGDTALILNTDAGYAYGRGATSLIVAPPEATFTGHASNYNGVIYEGVTYVVQTFFPSLTSWWVGFVPPGSLPLIPGFYPGALGFPDQSRTVPVLSFNGVTSYCSNLDRAFFVKQSGASVWIVFEQYCPLTSAGLYGELRVNANALVNLTAPLMKTVRRGQNLSFSISATEIDGRQVTLTASSLPTGATFTDNGNNTGTFSWTPNFTHEGSFNVTFRADNGFGATDTISTAVTVAGETRLIIQSDPGNYVGGNQNLNLTPVDGPFSAMRADGNGVYVSFDPSSASNSWYLQFAAPNNQPLTIGVYDNATIRTESDRPLLRISGRPFFCNSQTGSFQVKQIAYGPNGTVSSFWATFEQHCEGGAPALYGEVRYNLNLVTSVSAPRKVIIDPGQPVVRTVSASEVNGRTVTLTATGLPPGATFTDNRNNTGTFSWSPGADQEGVFSVTFQADNGQGALDTTSMLISVKARLTIVASGNGSVTTTGINCPGDCSESYTNGSTILLYASPAYGYEVRQWIGCDSSSAIQCTVRLSQAKTVSVVFGLANFALNVTNDSQFGTVTGNGVNCPGDCTESFLFGSNITLTAAPIYGYQARWSGCDSVSGNQCTARMDYHRHVWVTFSYKVSFPAQAYFPLRSGNFWTYSVNGQCCATLTVLDGATQTGYGDAAKAVQDSDGYIQYFSNDAAGLRLLGEYDPPSGFYVTYSPPIQITDASMTLGQTFNSSGVALTNFATFNYSTSYKIEAVDRVTVPLRNYPALRIRGTLTIIGGGTLVDTLYLAKNVGIIKESVTDGVETYDRELVATNAGRFNDFDGDGHKDPVVYRDGVWKIDLTTGANHSVPWGEPTWLPVPEDYDGDGLLDIAAYYAGAWSILRSTDGGNTLAGFGGPGWTPVPADYDGDGKADVAVYFDGAWSITRSSDGGNTTFAWGGPAWKPVVADYDGDGKADIAVYFNGAWAIKRSSDGGTMLTGHGGSTWQPVPGDYDGDGKADIAVYMNGAWSILRSSDNVIMVIGHGGPDWVPVPGDYDGDGKTDVAVYHAAGVWSIKRSSDGAIQVVGHGGGPADVPLN